MGWEVIVLGALVIGGGGWGLWNAGQARFKAKLQDLAKKTKGKLDVEQALDTLTQEKGRGRGDLLRAIRRRRARSRRVRDAVRAPGEAGDATDSSDDSG